MTRFQACLVAVAVSLVAAPTSAGVILLESDRGIGGSSDLLRWNCASPFVCVDYTQHPFGVNAPDDVPWIESQDDFVEIAELGASAHNVATQDSVIDLAALIFGGEGSAGSETTASDSTVFPWAYGIAGAGSAYSVTFRLTEFNYLFDVQVLLEVAQAGVYGGAWAGVSLVSVKPPFGTPVSELLQMQLGNDSQAVAASGVLTPGTYQFTIFGQTGAGNRPDWGLVFDDHVTSNAKWNGQLALT